MIERFKYYRGKTTTRFFHDEQEEASGDVIHRRIEAFDLAYEWCVEQFGSPSSVDRWYAYSWAFVIRDEADAVAFRLRWC
ncbi:MAG: hypothetical protein EOP83_16275 [Verrucomicrobiaceae bacterium]|nr:MAG: hypothetical protein EOP83_16275 [Verrucomicrobiaceae bacterium]